MRIRKKKWAEPELSVCNFYVKNPEENAGKWMQAFKKEQPLYLEIGCGKGGFAGQLALKNPDKNIIALDIKVDMLGVGRRTIVKLFEDAGKTQDDITNLLLVKYNVEMLAKSLRLTIRLTDFSSTSVIRGREQSTKSADLHTTKSLKCTKHS